MKPQIPDEFWTKLEQYTRKYSGLAAEMIIEDALSSMGKSSYQEISIPEVPVFLDKLADRLSHFASPKTSENYRKKLIDLFNQTFLSL